MKPRTSQNKLTLLEAFFFAVFALLLIIAYYNKSEGAASPLCGSALIAFAAFQISKIVRFYNMANTKINLIWFLSVALVVTSGGMSFFYWEWGALGVWGLVLFHYTWRHAFLDNRPEIC